jgi:hypothetical protein
MSRHQRLQKTLRSPVRREKKRKSRRVRIERRLAREAAGQ